MIREFETRLKELIDGRLKKIGGWDKGIPFKDAYELILEFAKELQHSEKQSDEKRFCYFVILLFQIRNGARISEAVRAFLHWLKTGEREFYIKLSKRKKGARYFIVPEEVPNEWRELLIDFESENEEKMIMRVKRWASKHGINTHALRYARLTYMLDSGADPLFVARISGHKKLDTLLEYVQEDVAVNIHKKLK